jgi:hypothetical protein
MSDNVRTSLRFTVVEQSIDVITARLADFFESQGDSTLIPDPTKPLGMRALFRPIADTPQKYQQPEWLETNELEPMDKSALVILANQYENFAIHTNFVFGVKAFHGSVYVFKATPSVDRSKGESSFVRLSFHSSLTTVLLGTNEFGGRVTIDQEIKSSLLEATFGIYRAIEAKGFVYGLERDGTSPLTVTQLRSVLLHPEATNPLFGAYLTGIDRSILSRADLIDVWEDEDTVKQSTTGIVMLDLLQDSDALVEDDEDEDEDAGE